MVVSDTSVVSNLLIIGELELLRHLFREVIVPDAVQQEVLALAEFGIDLKPYLQADWIKVQAPHNLALVQTLCASLDQGESEAIALAHTLPGCLLAIDEKAGRKVAQALGIPIIGLIGILIRAKAKGVIPEVKPLLDRIIQEAGFYLAPRFYQQILNDLGE